MAKKKGGGGSNLGLIITLVFFVLSTVILGVTTYMGYSDQEAKDKAKADALKEKAVAENDAKHYRLLYRMARLYMGDPAGGVEPADLARERAQFKAGQFQPSAQQKDKDEVGKFMDKYDAITKFDATKQTAPDVTLDKRYKDKEAEVDLWKGKIAALEKARDDARAELANEKEMLQQKIAGLEQAVTFVKDSARKDRDADLKAITFRETKVKEDADKQIGLRKEIERINEELAKLEKSLKKERDDKRTAMDERDRWKRDLDEAQRMLRIVAERTGFDLRMIEARELTVTAKEKLKNWHRTGKRWEIVNLDRTGKLPYINLGNDDRVRPQMTFSIHSVLPDGSLNPIPKGTLEVVRIAGPHLSQAKITSTTDPKKDPILKGDRLFHASWDPNKVTRVVIAGLIDIDGDRTDGTSRFIRMLEKQNIQVDAYIDANDEKAPRLVERDKGKPVTIDTEYVILGYNVNSLRHPKSNDADYVKQLEALRTKLKDAAKDNAVKEVKLSDYLEMIGMSSAGKK